MPEDDLEYFITFPSPVPSVKSSCTSTATNKSNNGDEDDDYVLVGSQGKEPVVFLLGWLGAQDHHLSKYSAIYNQYGCITIRYTAPTENLFFWYESTLTSIAKRLLSLLQDMSLDDHPVLFHCFSNHGSTLYYYISRLLEDMPHIQLKGCVFDSAPAPRRMKSAVRAIYRAIQGPLWMRIATATGLLFYLSLCTLASIGVTLITGTFSLNPPWALIHEKFRVPQLLLYSHADDLISSNDIEAFALARANIGVPVVTKCWQHSAHVQHLRKYPQVYKETVFSFISMCLSSTDFVTLSPKEDASD